MPDWSNHVQKDANSNGKKRWFHIFKRFSARQWLSLAVCMLANFGCAICISLQAPFFPNEAAKKGFGPSIYGFVFGSYSLTIFLMAPVFGKYMGTFGPKFLFSTGIFVSSTCYILFGFLGRASPTAFIVLSFVIRIVEAIGESAYTTASFSILAEEFPDHIATTFSVVRSAFGTGLILGPTLGGLLYAAGGYILPFAVMGSALFVIGISTKLLFHGHPELTHSGSQSSLLKVLRVPSVLLASVAICSAAISIGFLSATLEPHLEQFGLNAVQVGLMFGISGTIFALTSVGWGWLVEDKVHPKVLTIFGVVFICICYLLLGPAPFMPFKGQIWLCGIALAFHGLGVGGELLPTYVDAIQEAVAHGCPDSIETYSMMAGLWSGTFQLGNFIGPSVGGVIMEKLGFPWASVIILGYQALMGVVTLIFYLMTCSHGRKITPSKSEERLSLLTESSV